MRTVLLPEPLSSVGSTAPAEREVFCLQPMMGMGAQGCPLPWGGTSSACMSCSRAPQTPPESSAWCGSLLCPILLPSLVVSREHLPNKSLAWESAPQAVPRVNLTSVLLTDKAPGAENPCEVWAGRGSRRGHSRANRSGLNPYQHRESFPNGRKICRAPSWRSSPSIYSVLLSDHARGTTLNTRGRRAPPPRPW